MVNIIAELSKYLMIFLIAIYTFECFSVFGYHDAHTKVWILRRQNIWMFLIHFISFVVIVVNTQSEERGKIGAFYLMQVVLLGAIIILYTKLYPNVSRLVVNNMCMLLAVGFIMLTRLSYEKSVKQAVLVAVSTAVSLVVPIIIRKLKVLSQWRIFYAVAGVIALAIVVVAGTVSYGAKLSFSVGGFSIQPSELVKIIFVFFVAASFQSATDFRNVVITTIVAAVHVLILVASKDLGAALIIFAVYLVMLYVATRQPLYMVAGLAAGSVASVAGYYLFSHVRVRVNVWKDPFASYDQGGYQVAQSLFAIGTGGWFGMGLYQGLPNKIPVADEDFIFSAIAEEMGVIFALCLILICVSCYIMFLNIAMQLRNQFYKLIALGLGTCYIFQVFLAIGGVTKFIPSSGVTLPFVSYGGSSLLSTFLMFAIIQGLYIIREDEEEDIERKKRQKLQEKRRKPTVPPQDRRQGAGRAGAESVPANGRRRVSGPPTIQPSRPSGGSAKATPKRPPGAKTPPKRRKAASQTEKSNKQRIR